MNWIKITISSLALCVSPLLFGQLTQAWNSYEKMNSATAGLLYEKEANFTIRPNMGYNNSFTMFTAANYSAISKSGKYGFGINHLNISGGSSDYSLSSNLLKLNINRQFELRNGARLSAGIGLGGIYGWTSHREQMSGKLIKEGGFSFMPDISIAYASNRFRAGLSINGSFSNYGEDYAIGIFSAYTFGNENKLQFTPHVYLGVQSMNIGGTLAYKSKFFLGGGMKPGFGNNVYSTAGYRINNRFQINYSVDFKTSGKHEFSNQFLHEFGVAFQLNKR